jgi:hypothetical protein
LVNFKLELTNPSTIFEKEKIEVWSNKTDLAREMIENKIFSKDWIYKNVFNLSADDSEELLDQMVEDAKQGWRFKSIEEEGNDPAKPFKKINPNAGAGGGPPGSGPDSSLDDLGLPGGGGPEGGPGGGGMGAGPMGGPGGELPPLEESEIVAEKHGEHADDYVRPSQKGVKDARRDYPFGEDPLGNKENNAKTRPGRELTHVWANKSPLSLESVKGSGLIKSLQTYLDKTKPEKKELIKESQESGSKSLLDESNILEQ